MSAINYLTLVSTIVVTSSGTPVPSGYINIASTNSAPTWANSISTNGIQGSTIVVSSITMSTLTGSTLTAGAIGYSTLSGSTITSNNIVLSTLTVSSINGGAPGVAAYSTFNASSINATSTMTTSTLTTTGNVGIGSASPTANLQVSGSTSIYGLFRLANSTATTSNEVSMGYFNNPSASYSGATGSAWCHGIASFGVGANNFGFGCVNTALVMSMLSSGNVGIGITNPAWKLDVNGAVNSVGTLMLSDASVPTNGFLRITTSSGVNYIQSGLTQVSNSAADLAFTAIYGGSESMRIKSTGNVGIGTASPNATLQVHNSSAVGAGYGALLVDSPNAGGAGGCITIRNSAGGSNAFASLMFEIDGSTSCQTGSTPGAYAAGNGMIYCQNVGVGNNAGKLGFIQWTGGSEVETMTILPSGNVGINNTTPKSLLSVLGGQIMVETGSTNNAVEYVSPTPGIHLRGNGSGGTAQMVLECQGYMTAGVACNSAGINLQSQSGGSVFLKYGVAYSGDYGGGSTGLQVNASGVVLMPSQPYVSLGAGGTDASVAYNYQGACFGYSGFTAYLTPYQSVGFTNTQGNGWVAGYGTFTAPWTGRYQVNINFYWNSFTAGNRWSINTYNSSGTSLQSKYCCLEGGGFAADTTRPYGTTLYMSAGDYFQITLSSYNGGSCNAYYGGITHTSMTIAFLG